MNIELEPIRIEQKSVLVQMMELFLYDFSEFSGEDVNEYGYFGYSHIDDYWNEPDRVPFFIRADGRIAGFVLVRGMAQFDLTLAHPHNIAEFFVMKKYRRQGVGRRAAALTFDRLPGGWEVAAWTNNLPARAFWKQVIEDYTGGAFREFADAGEGHAVFVFQSGNA